MGNIFSSSGGIAIDVDMNPSPVIIAAAFGAMSDAVRLFSDPLKKAITDVVAPSISTNFQVGGRPPWQPLDPDTKGSGRGILIRTGLLASRAGQLEEWDISDDTAQMGVSAEIFYGGIHEEGSEKIPQREWALFQPEDVDKIEDIFDTWLGNVVEAALWL